MAKKPTTERVPVEIDDRIIHYLRILKMISLAEKQASSSKEKVVRKICEKLKVPYNNTGPYGVIYEGDKGDVHMELSSWSSQSVSWTVRYEALHEGIRKFLLEKKISKPEHEDIINEIIVFLDELLNNVEKNIGKGDKQYKPQVVSKGVDTDTDRVGLVDATVPYWFDE